MGTFDDIYQIFIFGTIQEKKNGKKSDIMHISVNPLPSYPINDIFKSDKLIQLTPTLLYEIMTNALVNTYMNSEQSTGCFFYWTP